MVFPCEGSSCTFSHDKGEEEKTDEAPTAAGDDDVTSDPESGQGWYMGV